jgi:peptidoglycan hydrolase-like protein with peptidoglycan-binding domain
MRPSLLALFCAGLACVHAKQVEAPSQAKPEPTPRAVAPSRPVPPPPPGHPALSESPEATFRAGAIRTLQDALDAAGYPAPRTGRLDEATQHQVALYQKAEAMPDTGFPDDRTLKKLGLDPAKLRRTTQ